MNSGFSVRNLISDFRPKHFCINLNFSPFFLLLKKNRFDSRKMLFSEKYMRLDNLKNCINIIHKFFSIHLWEVHETLRLCCPDLAGLSLSDWEQLSNSGTHQSMLTKSFLFLKKKWIGIFLWKKNPSKFWSYLLLYYLKKEKIKCHLNGFLCNKIVGDFILFLCSFRNIWILLIFWKI